MKRLGAPPFTCLITPGEATIQNFNSERSRIVDAVTGAVADGITMIQVREKRLPARLVFDLVSEVVRLSSASDALVVVNDRADIALAAGADGVQLPESTMPADVIRSTFGEELVIGVSTHSVRAAEDAVEAGADYIFFGPVFETPGKGAPRGVGELREVASRLAPFPVIALGGVDETNFAEAYDAGASGIAAIRAFNTNDTRRAILSIHRDAWTRMNS